MKLELEINNTDKSPVKKALIKKAIKMALEKSDYDELFRKNVSLSFAWVSESEMRRIDKLYRKKDQVTDVLSFCEYENSEELKKANDSDLFLGELILCYNYIKKSAAECASESDLQKELARVIAHGVLHLLGFEHGKKMFAIQNSVAEEFIA